MHGFGPLGRAQVTVARAQGQPICRALGFTAHHGDGQCKLLHHAAYHHQLLVVFFAKQGVAGAFGLGKHAMEQLHHHCAHAGEKAGAEVALQNVGQCLVGGYREGLWLGVEVALVGGKHHVATGGGQLVAVGLQRARVGVEVFVGAKLQAVDEDAGHRHVTQRHGLAHQVQVAVVQVAHGGHEGG